ncbi:MAG: HutD family protein [Elusimicrobia bacterium]|nr:HutD family protein [Elusimicrobiota bacterium]
MRPRGAEMMKILDADAARRVAWKNGRGWTLELATDADVPGGDWTWRLSIADVPARAPFSKFTGVDRCIACLAGPGLDLERAHTVAAVPREGPALAFAGEESVVGAPRGPGVRDVNLMLRRDRRRGRMTLARGTAMTLDAPLIVVHVPDGSPALRASAADGACDLPPGRTLMASGRVDIAAAPDSIVIACEIQQRAEQSMEVFR